MIWAVAQQIVTALSALIGGGFWVFFYVEGWCFTIPVLPHLGNLGAVWPSGAADAVEVFVAFFVVPVKVCDVHRVFFKAGYELWIVYVGGAADGGGAAGEGGKFFF